MPTRITVLVNDTAASQDLASEHGLALWIEHGGHCILFDTGLSGRVLCENAARLGVRLEDAEAVCLSHGHVDHTGGLATVLERLPGADVYAHPAVFVPKYVKRKSGRQSIGIGFSPDQLRAKGVRLHLSEGPQEVCPGATLTGEVDRDPRLAPSTAHLLAEGKTAPVPDPFRDDQALILGTDGGLVVVSGCAHAGIANHCRAAQGLMSEERLRAVVGGFHLVGASRELLEGTIAAFRDLDPEAIHPCHCTGQPATEALVRAFPDTCQPIAAGSTLRW